MRVARMRTVIAAATSTGSNAVLCQSDTEPRSVKGLGPEGVRGQTPTESATVPMRARNASNLTTHLSPVRAGSAPAIASQDGGKGGRFRAALAGRGKWDNLGEGEGWPIWSRSLEDDRTVRSFLDEKVCLGYIDVKA